MTSETSDKAPLIVLPFGHNRVTWQQYSGVIVIIATWVYLYFACIGTLYDGLYDFFWHGPAANVLTSVVFETTERIVTGAASNTVEFGSGKYYALCGLGGILSCGITHTAIVPLDLIKCRIQVSFKNFLLLYFVFLQVNPEKYKGIFSGFRTTVAEEGVRALAKGWAPTAIGYSLQGLGKFGFYELFKVVYGDLIGPVSYFILVFEVLRNCNIQKFWLQGQNFCFFPKNRI